MGLVAMVLQLIPTPGAIIAGSMSFLVALPEAETELEVAALPEAAG